MMRIKKSKYKKLKRHIKQAEMRLQDFKRDYWKIVNDQGANDERHCGCVPVLRAHIAELKIQLEIERKKGKK